MTWARAAVTFLRGRCWLEADFFVVDLVDLWVLAVEAVFFFFVDVDEASCAAIPQHRNANKMTRGTNWKRLKGLTGFSVARFLATETTQIIYETDSGA
jgi:hypothetical protein